jgi:hypothetical protein
MLKILLSLVSDLIAYRRAMAGDRLPSGFGQVSIWPIEAIQSPSPFPTGRRS